jgi:uncharacterized protein YkwD
VVQGGIRPYSQARAGLALALAAAALAASPALALARSNRQRLRVDRIERAVVRAVNVVRRHHRLCRLHVDRRMSYGAALQSEGMARRRLADHGAWTTRLPRYAGVQTVGEVIGWLRSRPSTSQAGAIMRMWMHSPPHRAVLLSGRFSRLGVGRTVAPGGVTFFTVDVAGR